MDDYDEETQSGLAIIVVLMIAMSILTGIGIGAGMMSIVLGDCSGQAQYTD